MFDEIDTATELEIYNVLGQYACRELSLTETAIELSVSQDVIREVLDRHDIEIREPTKYDLAEDAAECLQPSDHGDGYSYNYEDRVQLEEAVSAIIERINVDTDQFRISEQELRLELKRFLWDAKTDDGNTSEIFWNEIEDIHRYLERQDRTQYKIVFPLNVEYIDVDRPDEYAVLGETVHATTDEEWASYCDQAYDREQEKVEESDVVGARNELEKRFEDSPNALDMGGQTYWKIEIEAIDRAYAMNRCTEVLEFLLGRINFALTRGRAEGDQYNSSVWNTRWMDLRFPFVYLVYEDGEYSTFYHGTDPTPRKPFTLSSHKADRYRTHLNDIPPMSDDRNRMEERLVKAVGSFLDAVTSTDREDVFLNYWRGAERLTLMSETETASTVVKRAKIVTKSSSAVSQSSVSHKRNKLVHEGDSVEITTDDMNVVKDMLEELILLYVEKASEWQYNDFRFFFEHGNKSEGALSQLENERRTELNLIDEIRDRN